MMNTGYVQLIAYYYGCAYEQRNQALVGSDQHRELDKLCLFVSAELRYCGALDENAMPKSEYVDSFNKGRNSVSDYEPMTI